MISICIPVYNYPVKSLIGSLHQQMKSMGGDVELVCIDDHSDENHRQQNAEMLSLADKWVYLDENVGRARIRNMFLKYARGEWLLFLDNDMSINDGFLRRYADTLSGNPDVVVGGIAYDSHKENDNDYSLRLRYGKKVESRPARIRNRHPYRSFMTGNFMIRRDVLETIGFDDRITGYGHEDTLFGYRLQQHGTKVLHIDNAAVNGNVETNAEFLSKTEEAVGNLSKIYRFMHDEPSFYRSVRLLQTYHLLQKTSLIGFVKALYLRRKPALKHQLTEGGDVSVRKFNFYKLGLFIELINH